MQRPIVVISLLFLCGIFIEYVTKISISITILVGLVVWVFCLLCFCSKKFSIFLLPCISIFIVVISMAYYDCRTNFFPSRHITRIVTTDKSLLRVKGVIVNPPIILDEDIMNKRLLQSQAEQTYKKPHDKISFTLQAKEIETASGWKSTEGFIKVNLYVKKEYLHSNTIPSSLSKLVYGQEVELFGHVFLPKSPSNPGEFNYKTYLQRQLPPIGCLMTVVNVNNIRFKDRYYHNRVYVFVYAIKNVLNNVVYMNAFSNSAPLISSVLLGYRADLSGEMVDNFMKTGIIHFIAISGFNVGIIVFTLFLPLRIMGINQSVITGIVLCVVILYAFLTGLSPSVLRASIMVIVFLCSFIVRRQWDITSGIFTAILCILLRNPPDLFNIGFQLSVLATMGIVYGSSRIEGALFKTALFIETLQVKAERGRLFHVKRFLRKSICVSLAAWLATLPLTARYFHIFTPFIPLTNIIVFPLFWIIIVCGVVLLTLGAVCPPLAAVSAWLASQADIALESLISAQASLPYSYFYVIGPSTTGIVVYYLFVLFLLYYDYLVLDRTKIVIWGLLSAHILVFTAITKFPNRTLTITCLDVGHGGAVCVQFPNGKNLLYDVGTWQNYDVGRYIVAPFLWKQGIKKIDLVVLSHEHEDHWNGFPSIVERFHIKSVCTQPGLLASKTGQKLRSYLEEKRVCIEPVSYGEVLKGFDPAVVKILNPKILNKPSTINDDSCVLRIEYGGHSILLCADIQEKGIESILSNPSELKSDIIQIPHHGSYSKNLEKFINTVLPMYAFIDSCDDITSEKTLNVLNRRDIITLQTHKEGAVTFKLCENRVTYFSFNKSK